MKVLVVDGANVVGARPDGWWKDRAGAARGCTSGWSPPTCDGDIVLVLEGEAKAGVPADVTGTSPSSTPRRTATPRSSGRPTGPPTPGSEVTVVTADRLLAARVAKAGPTVGPTWLLDRLG